MDLRLLELALATLAIGTGSLVFAGLIGGVAEDLSISVGYVEQLIMPYAVVYPAGSPVLVTITSRVTSSRSLRPSPARR